MEILRSLAVLCALCMPSDTPPRLLPFPEDVRSFQPYDEKPELLNLSEVTAAYLRFYPSDLRARGVEATAMIWLELDAAGQTRSVAIKQTSRHAAFDEAALRMGRTMRFSAARRRGAGIATAVQIPIVFSRAVYEKNRNR